MNNYIFNQILESAGFGVKSFEGNFLRVRLKSMIKLKNQMKMFHHLISLLKNQSFQADFSPTDVGARFLGDLDELNPNFEVSELAFFRALKGFNRS